ncbi:cgcaxxgcc motif [Lucifera butyrica]|uniref:Cgcaxxgcc motif n=1 Tax=Lucifera butyrica TaxID=1351585 RepID=A0A498R9S6_9FIRM|nr:C-GCAxxG-C-C family protein [Lucifera butyrica]VBB08131.1 cgcaxxgcc motif [Lucifera butyrica]
MKSDRIDQAVSSFKNGLSCSQAILSTYGPLFGINQDDAIRIARGFGGGMARLSETCGAVTGAFMVIGIKSPGADKQVKEETYLLIQKFAEKFRSINGSLNCGQLLGCDLNTSEGQEQFRNKEMAKSHCEKYVRNSAELLEELLQLEKLSRPVEN